MSGSVDYAWNGGATMYERTLSTDQGLAKLQELARYIASRTVTVAVEASVTNPYPDKRYWVLVDGNRVRSASWTYDQAWCVLVGMRAV